MPDEEPVLSPFSGDCFFNKKVKELFVEGKVRKAFIFYVANDGDFTTMETGLDSGDLVKLANLVKDKAARRIEEDDKYKN